MIAAALSLPEGCAVLACLCVAAAVAVAMTVRRMARNDAELRWPVSGSPCEDPER